MKIEMKTKENYVDVNNYEGVKNDDFKLIINHKEKEYIYQRNNSFGNELFIFNDCYINNKFKYQDEYYYIKDNINEEFILTIKKIIRYLYNKDIMIDYNDEQMNIYLDNNKDNLIKVSFAYFIADILRYEYYREIIIVLDIDNIEDYMYEFIRKENIYKNCNYICYSVIFTK